MKCPKCGLGPSIYQEKEQEKRELDYIKENGLCSACEQDMQENEED